MEQRELQELLKKVDKVYSEPLDVYKFLIRGRVKEFFDLVIREAIKEYESRGASPIVEMQKYRGFMVDYYFLLNTFCKYIDDFSSVKEVSERVVERVRNDFLESDKHIRNGKLFVAAMENLGYLVSSSSKKFFYSKLCLANDKNGKKFIVCAVTINSEILNEYYKESFKKIKEFAGRDVVTFKGTGSKFVGKFYREGFKNKEEIIAWD